MRPAENPTIFHLSASKLNLCDSVMLATALGALFQCIARLGLIENSYHVFQQRTKVRNTLRGCECVATFPPPLLSRASSSIPDSLHRIICGISYVTFRGGSKAFSPKRNEIVINNHSALRSALTESLSVVLRNIRKAQNASRNQNGRVSSLHNTRRNVKSALCMTGWKSITKSPCVPTFAFNLEWKSSLSRFSS